MDAPGVTLFVIAFVAVIGIVIFAAQGSRREFVSRLNTIHFQARQAEAEQAAHVHMRETAAYRKAVSRMAHDLQTPIAAIRSGLHMILQGTPEVGMHDDATDPNASNSVIASGSTAITDMHQADIPYILRTIVAANHWCELFVDDYIREMKMLNGGNQSFVPQTVLQSVMSMVEETVAVLASGQQLANAVKFGLSIDPLVPATVQLDACIRRMLMNLISNACRSTQVGSIHVDVRLEPKKQGFLRFTVTDTGCGIKDDHKAQLFEPFVSNSDHNGIGLGIFMVKEQSEALGGWCGHSHNPEGNGAVFFFSIPFAPSADDSSEHMAMTEADALVQCVPVPTSVPFPLVSDSCHADSRQNVLLVDDNIPLLQLCSMELNLDGWNVTTAHGAEEALHLMKSNLYSVVLTDIRMPHKGGIELCMEYRKWELECTTRTTQQAIFAITGLKDADMVKKCMSAGMQGVVQKPLNAAKLIGCFDAMSKCTPVTGGQCPDDKWI